MKWRETDRKGKDLARECDSLTKQLAAKESKKINLEQQMHKIQVEQERRKAVSLTWKEIKGGYYNLYYSL